MEKTTTVLLAAFILLIYSFTFSINSCLAQWQPDVRLTNNPALSLTNQYTNGRCIASSGDTVHVVWYDTRDGASPEIYYKRSIDGGINWGADTRVTNNIYFSSNPSVAVSGSVVHIVWQDNRNGNYQIYYNRSTNGGINWGTDTRLTIDSAGSETPCISASGSVVHVVWRDFRNSFLGGAYYKRSSDGGINWGADTRIKTDTVGGSWWPSISASGSVVHSLWMDSRNGQQDIYYKRSTDAGINWGTDMPLTNDTNHRYTPTMSVSGSNVHIAFLDSRNWDPGYEIYYKHSTNGGISWSADMRLTIHYTSASLHSVIAASGSNVHVVWDDNRNSATNYEIYYKRSTNGGINWGADTRLTYDSSYSMYPFVSASGTAVHCVWSDYRNGNYEIYYKRDPSGNPIGITNINLEIPSSFSLSQNYPNPFNPTTVIKFDIPKSGEVSLKVYDVLGREIASLVNENLKTGSYSMDWNASQCPSGVYFYRLTADGFKETRRMIYLK